MAAACLLVPTAAHVAAGGAAPVQAGFLVMAALLSVACVALADRRRSAGEIAALLLLTQPLLHVLLTLGGHGDMTSAVPGPSMALAHIVSAGTLTILLAGAENVAWSLAALSATVLLTRVRRLLARPPLPRPARVVVDSVADAATPRSVELIRSTPWRGPPVPAGTR